MRTKYLKFHKVMYNIVFVTLEKNNIFKIVFVVVFILVLAFVKRNK